MKYTIILLGSLFLACTGDDSAPISDRLIGSWEGIKVYNEIKHDIIEYSDTTSTFVVLNEDGSGWLEEEEILNWYYEKIQDIEVVRIKINKLLPSTNNYLEVTRQIQTNEEDFQRWVTSEYFNLDSTFKNTYYYLNSES